MKHVSSQSGTSLIEVVVYIALLAIMGTAITFFAAQIIRHNAHARNTAQVIDSARSTLAFMTSEIRQSSRVYTPTSTLGAHPGQLSLATTKDLPSDENETYVDFYIDNNRLYQKKGRSSR